LTFFAEYENDILMFSIDQRSANIKYVQEIKYHSIYLS